LNAEKMVMMVPPRIGAADGMTYSSVADV
jgi:hypothetical protein